MIKLGQSILVQFIINTLTLRLWGNFLTRIKGKITRNLFLGCGLFGAFFFLLIIVSDVTPAATLNRPTLGLYLYLNMLLVVIAMGISTIVIWLYDQEDKEKRSYIMEKVCLMSDLSLVMKIYITWVFPK